MKPTGIKEGPKIGHLIAGLTVVGNLQPGGYKTVFFQRHASICLATMSTLTKLISARRALTNRLPVVLSRSYHDDGVYGYRVRKEYQLPDCEYI